MLELTHGKVGIERTFLGLMSGYFMNLIVPRMGEVTRCAVLKRTDSVKMASSLSSVIQERLIDVVILLTLIFLTVIIEGDRIATLLQEVILGKVDSFKSLTPFILIALGGLVAVCLLFFMTKNLIKRSIVYVKVRGFVSEMSEGFRSIKKLDNPIPNPARSTTRSSEVTVKYEGCS